jgi:arylsulfatase A-like enzyme
VYVCILIYGAAESTDNPNIANHNHNPNIINPIHNPNHNITPLQVQGRFNNSYPPRTPNYNFSDSQCKVSDTHCGHHWQVKTQPPLSAEDEGDIGKWYTNVLMSLLSVDDIVKALHSILTATPASGGHHTAWDNTVWLYTSDHGVSMGQFRIPCVKRQVYESNTRIPSFVKAPGVAADPLGRYELVSHVDAAPTLLGLAGAGVYLAGLPVDTFDGRDFSVRLRGGSGSAGALPHWKSETILEYHLRDIRWATEILD